MLDEISLCHSLANILPEKLKAKAPDNYLLYSKKGSVTPWHTDYTGTSVFYFLLSGVKEFFFLQPTPSNKELAEIYETDQLNPRFAVFQSVFHSNS